MRNKPKVVWLQALTCNGNTQSFLSSNQTRFEHFLNAFDLVYHPCLTNETSLQDILDSSFDIDFLLVEGAITSQTHFFSLCNKSAKYILQQLTQRSQYVICVGSCASYGGIHAKFEYNNDIVGVQSSLDNLLPKSQHPIINLTGCPVHPEWILQTLFTLQGKKSITLDSQNRPVELYSHLAHHGCVRNEYFEWKVEAHTFGLKEGCLFYDQGCRGPMTHSSCNKILWNDISSKTRVGMPCIGCTEFDFPRENLFETKKNIGIPAEVPLGISKRAYLSLTGVAKTFKIERLNKKIIDENS
ncbi:MAG: Ni/Fe hydrogenase [Deltaproteobacteria bacterium HGW-Deltaproteobacteria-24]|jgi:hydrogenase small subunit|nr:MAG: Ni/Fe hydrogenase [Deltaproteobacteria bacterium HGW-Deltaproteobacteria-24]